MDAPDLSDLSVLRAFRGGDRTVLAALYKAHHGAVKTLLTRGFGFLSQGKSIRFQGFSEPFEVQEMIQDGFLHAFRESARQRYDPARPYRPYLITIIKNLMIDRYRRQRLERRLFVTVGHGDGETAEEAMDRLAAGTPSDESSLSPELQAMQRQLSALLETFINTLDDVDRRIITDHLMGDLSQAAVATALEVDRNDVRKRIKNMREALLRYLKSQGYVSQLDAAELFQRLLLVIGL